jgi:DNA-binding response OmpR family regulator
METARGTGGSAGTGPPGTASPETGELGGGPLDDPRRTIVVVEDDPSIADLVALYLQRAGFEVAGAGDARAGAAVIGRLRPCLAIIDLGLPGPVDGLDLCRQLRAAGPLPIVVLTARGDEIDRVLGLELGADDYITKPFSPRELVARVKAVLRRSDAGPVSEGPTQGSFLSAGTVTIDLGRREVTEGGRVVAVTTREFDLLAFLVRNAGLALSRAQILDGVWGAGWYGDERTIDVHVRQLRAKLGDGLPLVTVRGLGYRLG